MPRQARRYTYKLAAVLSGDVVALVVHAAGGRRPCVSDAGAEEALGGLIEKISLRCSCGSHAPEQASTPRRRRRARCRNNSRRVGKHTRGWSSCQRCHAGSVTRREPAAKSTRHFTHELRFQPAVLLLTAAQKRCLLGPARPMAARLLFALGVSALCRHTAGWQGAAGPNYYVGDDTLTLHSLTAPTAVCNDGSPAAYYWSQGTNSDLWVLYLEGGASRGQGCRAGARGRTFLEGCFTQPADPSDPLSPALYTHSAQATGVWTRHLVRAARRTSRRR